MDLDHESLDLVLQAPDLVHEITGFVRSNAGGNHSSADTAGATKSSLGWDIAVGNILWDKLA